MDACRFDRATIREYVRKESEDLVAHALAGGNTAQKTLDQQDILNQMIAPMLESDRNAFMKIYIEEVNASVSQLHIDAENANIKAEAIRADSASLHALISRDSEAAEKVGKFIGLIIIVVAVLYLLSKLSR